MSCRRLAATLLVFWIPEGACYRGDPAPTTPSTSAMVQTPECNTDNDLAHPVRDPHEGRLRVHSTAPLTVVRGRASGKNWVGPPIPDYVPKKLDTLDLMLMDEVEGGVLALYREPYNVGSCQLRDDSNCAYAVRRYRDGKVAWALDLDRLFTRTDHLEVQDIRLSGDVLYFNEACQTYSNEAGGDCSSLVAVDPRTGRVLWRTPTLTSNNRFVVESCFIIAGYGFTGEPDELSLIDRATGAVLQRVPVATAPERYTLVDGRIDVTLYSGSVRRFKLDGAARKLVALDPEDPDLYGGAAYGGAAYGGATYGRRLKRP